MLFPMDKSGREKVLAAALPTDPDERKALAKQLLAPSLVLPKDVNPHNNGGK
jgi:hypothetical protein